MSSWLSTRPAVVLSHVRSGSTLLAHYLSTHPEISCPRAEPLEPRSVWRRTWPQATLPEILTVVLGQWGYTVSACKLTTKHLTPDVEQFLIAHGVFVIYLWRENVLRTALSAILHTRYRRGELKVPMEHRLTPLGQAVNVTIEPKVLLAQCRRVVQLQARLKSAVARMGLPTLPLTYTQITGGKEASALPQTVNTALCDFLQIERVQMTATLRRLNPQPLSEILTNWSKVEPVVRASAYARWIEDENG